MRQLKCLFTLFFLLVSPLVAEPEMPSTYQPELAQRAGADAYGMRPYVMAFLKKGPTRPTDTAEGSRLMRAHLDNIGRLVNEGKLCVAGPFSDDGEMRGIYIFCVNSVEEARALTESDPAIKAGSLIMELHPWYGPAGLTLLEETQAKIRQKKI